MMNEINRYANASAGRLEQFNDFIKDISNELVLVEFGPGSGDTLRQIERVYSSAVLTGFDMAPTKVSDKCRVHKSDLNSFEFSNYAEIINRANVFLMLDVLEHLSDPVNFLLRLNDLSANSARYVISCPNFSSIRMLSAWINGKIPRNEFGFFDRTHLHWFSPSEFILLFRGLNFSKVRVSYIFSKNRFIRSMQKIWPSRLCSQFIVYSIK